MQDSGNNSGLSDGVTKTIAPSEVDTKDASTVSEEASETEILNRLENRVQTAVDMIRSIREERDELRQILHTKEERILELEGEVGKSAQTDQEVSKLKHLNDRLVQDRTHVMHRIEELVGRLQSVGLE
ncbi:MAG: cell division protein ZapB [Candidatus Eisenbacteria bacterium]|uniref:Cell division protein ZapB n=1 Tax=Eiseniibacteriota bacterium TaxID=2212470 RepID=A0A7Y2H324_UNCEI|nr:cell division protein ZapB [Candidatus Eisenbacteria bacterium]